MTKQALRKEYLQKRQQLTESECQQLSQRLCGHFFDHINLTSIKTLHTFLPIRKKKEPDTWLIIDKLVEKKPAIDIVIPKVEVEGVMSHYIFEQENLTTSIWGIPEPTDGTQVEPPDIDLVIVPLLVADKRGHRVGYGKGFYDRFLAACRPDCMRIGLAFFDPIDKIDELHPHDLPLHYCITPSGIYQGIAVVN